MPQKLRNLLSYPGGYARAGFNPAHPASNFGGNGASFIPASGGAYINLLTGQPTAKVFTQPYGVGAAGPYVQSNTSTAYGAFTNAFPTTVSPGFTIAGIFTYVASNGGGVLLATSSTSGSGIEATIRSGVFGYRNGSLYTFSPVLPTMVVGTPYFVALSDNGTTCYGVQVNMLTGQISTSSVATASGLSQGSTTTWNLGGQASGGTEVGGNIHALMGAFVFLPPAQLKAWAADPWAFWYPSTVFDLTTSAPTSSGVTGTLAVTEAGDTLSAGAMLSVSGTLSVTEAADTLSATGTSLNYGVLTVTEASDTLSATGMLVVTGTLTVTEANDTLSAAGTVTGTITGVLTITEAGDTLSATGMLSISGILTITEASDTLSATGTISAPTLVTGVLTVTEAPDTLTTQAWIYMTPPVVSTQPFFNPGSEWQFWDRLTDRSSVQ